MSNALKTTLLLALCAACTACHAPSGQEELAKRNFTVYQSEVFPVLMRDCAFFACHGAPERFFRLWGPGRARMNPLTRAFDLSTGAEASATYQSVLSMIDARHPSQSLLLRKPLAIEAGGAGHLGSDKFGRNVYRSVNDAGYLTLARWVLAATAAPTPAAAAK